MLKSYVTVIMGNCRKRLAGFGGETQLSACRNFYVSSLCVAARGTAGDRDTDACVLNENDSQRISILPALAVPRIL